MISFFELMGHKVRGIPCQGILMYEDDSFEYDGVYLKFDEYLLKLHADDRHVWADEKRNSRAAIENVTIDEFNKLRLQVQSQSISKKIVKNNIAFITLEETFEIPDIDSFFWIGNNFLWIAPDNAEISWYVLDKEQSNGLAKYLDQWINYTISDNFEEDEFKKTQDFDIYFKGKGLGKVKGIRVVGQTSKTLQVNDEDLDDIKLREHLLDILQPIIEDDAI